MIPNVYSVGDGLTLRVCRTEKFKTGMLSVSVALPIREESAYLTSLLLAVLHRGTEKYPTLAALNQRLDYLWGTELLIRNFYCGDAHVIGVCAELLDDAYLPLGSESLLEGVLDVMRELLFHPLLDENGLLLSRYVESEKRVQCDHIRSLQNQPRAYAVEQCRRLLYDKEPYGTPIYGSVEEVMATTPERLTEHWRQLTKTMRPDCFYVGTASAERIRAALLSSFGKELSDRKNVPILRPSTVIRQGEPLRVHEETLPVGQGQLILGLRTGIGVNDPAFSAVAIYNELLGVSPISKLFVNVREKRSLCYHCSSSYNVYKGAIMITCGIENANRQAAEEAILREIRAIAEGDFDDDELLAAKKSLENSYNLLEDSAGALENYYYGRSLAGVPDNLEHTRLGFASVTREDVIRVAQAISVDVIYYLKGTLSGEEDEDDVD